MHLWRGKALLANAVLLHCLRASLFYCSEPEKREWEILIIYVSFQLYLSLPPAEAALAALICKQKQLGIQGFSWRKSHFFSFQQGICKSSFKVHVYHRSRRNTSLLMSCWQTRGRVEPSSHLCCKDAVDVTISRDNSGCKHSKWTALEPEMLSG